MTVPFIKIDLHGMREDEAVKVIDKAIAGADSTTYHIQLVHARWEDGLAGMREKKIMDLMMDTDKEGDVIWKTDEILSTDLKKMAGFGKGKEKNYPGIVTGLQMQTYLVITGLIGRKPSA